MNNVKIVDIPDEEVGNGIIWNIHEDVLEEEDETLEERLTKAIAEKLLQNESLLNKLRGK